MSKSNESGDHQCHVDNCSRDGELRLYLPNWGESRVVCRRYLRRINPEIDAKTWLKTGYASWLPCNDDHLPISPDDLRDGERIRKREILDETMGWAE